MASETESRTVLHSSSPLEYQLEILKLEITTINESIRQMDDITKNVKQWSIVLWTAAVGGALTHPEFTKYLVVTAAIPMLFWFVDATYRRIQRQFIWRSMQISKFLNERLTQSFTENRLVDFELLDPKGRTYEGLRIERLTEYEKFTSLWSVMLFKSVSTLYAGMIVISLILWLLLYFVLRLS